MVNVSEIAELLGVTHQRVSVIVREPGFPAPVSSQGQSRVWDRREVAAWAKREALALVADQRSRFGRRRFPRLVLADEREHTRSCE